MRRAPHPRRTAVTASVAIHVGLAVLVLSIGRPIRVRRAPPALTWIAVDAIAAAPVPAAPVASPSTTPPGEAGGPTRGRAVEKAGPPRRRARPAPAPAATPAATQPEPDALPDTPTAPALPDPAALATAVQVEPATAPVPDTGQGADRTGTGTAAGSGNGVGAGSGQASSGTGTGGARRVAAPHRSLARPPRPKRDYRRWAVAWPPGYADERVLLELTIDKHGEVAKVRVIDGVDNRVDNRAIDTAQRFEFEPALDAAGRPTTGVHRWEFVIEGDPFDFPTR